jgi:PPOX class probable F420-dependent enzyme
VRQHLRRVRDDADDTMPGSGRYLEYCLGGDIANEIYRKRRIHSSMSPEERAFVADARVGRLATVDNHGRPHAVPICFTLVDETLISPLDEKAQTVGPRALRRVQNIEANPHVAVVVDRYVEDWSQLGWVQIRGRASLLEANATDHSAVVDALREKYDQYADHALEERPVIQIEPGSVSSWGDFSRKI